MNITQNGKLYSKNAGASGESRTGKNIKTAGESKAMKYLKELAEKFVDKFYEITTYVPPKDIGIVLTRYAKDFQEWWREPRPNISEW